jgi:hypothetical protein
MKYNHANVRIQKIEHTDISINAYFKQIEYSRNKAIIDKKRINGSNLMMVGKNEWIYI